MQLDLSIKTPAPEVSPEDVEQLCATLKGRGWVYARDLAATSATLDDRKLRAIANASDGRIISGQKGYRLLDGSAAIEDADRSATWLESQARQMLRRAAQIRRRLHRYAKDPAH